MALVVNYIVTLLLVVITNTPYDLNNSKDNSAKKDFMHQCLNSVEPGFKFFRSIFLSWSYNWLIINVVIVVVVVVTAAAALRLFWTKIKVGCTKRLPVQVHEYLSFASFPFLHIVHEYFILGLQQHFFEFAKILEWRTLLRKKSWKLERKLEVHLLPA